MKKTLPAIRVATETHEQMEQAMKKFNSASILNISLQEFRRLSYEYFSQIILQEKEKEIRNLLHLQ